MFRYFELSFEGKNKINIKWFLYIFKTDIIYKDSEKVREKESGKEREK